MIQGKMLIKLRHIQCEPQASTKARIGKGTLEPDSQAAAIGMYCTWNSTIENLLSTIFSSQQYQD